LTAITRKFNTKYYYRIWSSYPHKTVSSRQANITAFWP